MLRHKELYVTRAADEFRILVPAKTKKDINDPAHRRKRVANARIAITSDSFGDATDRLRPLVFTAGARFFPCDRVSDTANAWERFVSRWIRRVVVDVQTQPNAVSQWIPSAMMRSTISRFERRFAPYQARLYGYAIAMTRDRDKAHELLHDCVVRAIAARDYPTDEPAFRAWLFTILRNLWIDQIRANRRQTSMAANLSDAVSELPVSLENVVVNAFAVRQAFELLSHEHREVLALVDISGFSYQEAANIIAVPRGTIMSRISRARQALARLLADDVIPVTPRSRTSVKS